jgi:predicted nucleic acid-binding protein
VSVVVADTSPLNYLVQCETAEVLFQLYGQVVIPPAVFSELADAGAPEPVRKGMQPPPSWISVRSPQWVDQQLALGRGEVEAICLAQEIHADEILLDDRRARTAALERGLTVTGTLGVLEAAANRHFLKLAEVLEKLEQTNFRIDPVLVQEALRRDAQRLERERASQRPPGREPGIER